MVKPKSCSIAALSIHDSPLIPSGIHPQLPFEPKGEASNAELVTKGKNLGQKRRTAKVQTNRILKNEMNEEQLGGIGASRACHHLVTEHLRTKQGPSHWWCIIARCRYARSEIHSCISKSLINHYHIHNQSFVFSCQSQRERFSIYFSSHKTYFDSIIKSIEKITYDCCKALDDLALF